MGVNSGEYGSNKSGSGTLKVLLVGKGGREHALAWKISNSELCHKLYLWPGNAAMAPLGEVFDLAPDADFEALADHAKGCKIDLVVCGPEAPLADGLADTLATHGIPVFGPRKQAAMLEASKEFSKKMMQDAGVPTATYVVAEGEEQCRKAAYSMLNEIGATVIKADGLAGGKGVFVCENQDHIDEALKRLYQSSMKSAAERVVVEERLIGRECSYFTFLGSHTEEDSSAGSTGLGFAVDFKRLNDGDLGPNTGGMGCYAPVPWLPDDAGRQIEEKVVKPLVKHLASLNIFYTGCLYVGVMWTADGPKVIEFNVRLGDPEAQLLSMYDDRDWLALMASKCGIKVPSDAL